MSETAARCHIRNPETQRSRERIEKTGSLPLQCNLTQHGSPLNICFHDVKLQQWKCNHASLQRASLNTQHTDSNRLTYGKSRLQILLLQLSVYKNQQFTFKNNTKHYAVTWQFGKQSFYLNQKDNYLWAVTSLTDVAREWKYIVLQESITERSWPSDNCPWYRSAASKAPWSFHHSLLTNWFPRTEQRSPKTTQKHG